ncbi:hypothetical protein D3C86_2095390 [compost metagenome]
MVLLLDFDGLLAGDLFGGGSQDIEIGREAPMQGQHAWRRDGGDVFGADEGG